MLATLVREPFHRPGWVYKEKYDGDRAIAYRDTRGMRLVSRNLKDVTVEFREIARALECLPGRDLILDGEVVAFVRSSRCVRLHRTGRNEPDPPTALGAARALEAVVPRRRGVLMLARRLRGDGFKAYRTAQAKGWEGIIAKDAAAPYEPGQRSRSWLKVKCRRESEFVIGGFTAPSGKRQHFGALLVGLYDGENLRFTGKIGTGYSRSAGL